MQATRTHSTTTLVLATLALAACLWVGWSDIDLYVPQETVRASIRATPRLLVQAGVQFVAPIVLVLVIARAATQRWRAGR
jgi:hypothetical protein